MTHVVTLHFYLGFLFFTAQHLFLNNYSIYLADFFFLMH